MVGSDTGGSGSDHEMTVKNWKDESHLVKPKIELENSIQQIPKEKNEVPGIPTLWSRDFTWLSLLSLFVSPQNDTANPWPCDCSCCWINLSTPHRDHRSTKEEVTTKNKDKE
jgi:hypothetical protein